VKLLAGVISALPTEARSHPPPAPTLPSLPRSTLTLAHPEAGPLRNVANGTTCSGGRKLSGMAPARPPALGSPPLRSWRRDRSETRCCRACSPHWRVGAGLGLCQVLPARFVRRRATGSDQLFQLGRGQSASRVGAAALACIWGDAAGSAQPRPWEKGEARAPGLSVTCGAPEPRVIFPGSATTWPGDGKVVCGVWRGWCCAKPVARWAVAPRQTPSLPLAPAICGIASVCGRGGAPTQALPPAPGPAGLSRALPRVWQVWGPRWHMGSSWFLCLGWDGRAIPGWGLCSLPALPPDRPSSASLRVCAAPTARP